MFEHKPVAFIQLLIILLLTVDANNVSAAPAPKVICSKNSNGALTLRATCARGETRILRKQNLLGAVGPTGAAGSEK